MCIVGYSAWALSVNPEECRVLVGPSCAYCCHSANVVHAEGSCMVGGWSMADSGEE